jgi:two-component system response regulator AtoC
VEDILLLARYYVEEFNKKLNKKVRGFSKDSEEVLKKYPWPGNVRELRNIIERIMIIQNIGKVIMPENLPAELKTASRPDLTNNMPDLQNTIDFKTTIEKMTNDIRQKILLSALERGKGKKSAAAKLLGISRYTMIRELKKIGKP